jgi:hypothetical protein
MGKGKEEKTVALMDWGRDALEKMGGSSGTNHFRTAQCERSQCAPCKVGETEKPFGKEEKITRISTASLITATAEHRVRGLLRARFGLLRNGAPIPADEELVSFRQEGSLVIELADASSPEALTGTMKENEPHWAHGAVR